MILKTPERITASRLRSATPLLDKSFSDQTGHFDVASRTGNNYISVVHDYNSLSNSAMKNRTGACIHAHNSNVSTTSVQRQQLKARPPQCCTHQLPSCSALVSYYYIAATQPNVLFARSRTISSQVFAVLINFLLHLPLGQTHHPSANNAILAPRLAHQPQTICTRSK